MRVFPPADEFVLKKSALPALEAETKHVDIRWIKNFNCRKNIVWMKKIRITFCTLSIAKNVAFVTFIVLVVKVSPKLETTKQSCYLKLAEILIEFVS